MTKGTDRPLFHSTQLGGSKVRLNRRRAAGCFGRGRRIGWIPCAALIACGGRDGGNSYPSVAEVKRIIFSSGFARLVLICGFLVRLGSNVRHCRNLFPYPVKRRLVVGGK